MKTTSNQTANIPDLIIWMFPHPGRFRANDRDEVDQNLLVVGAVVIDNWLNIRI